ncbi:MAG TPA: hypothetical protein VHT68_08385 [Pseudolabrys sp.]|nr:hypothetical protein [Pseudolabrys sp.]
MQAFVRRNCARIEDTLFPPRRWVIPPFPTELGRIDSIVHRATTVGNDRELPAGRLADVIAHGCYQVYVTQMLFEDRRPILREPFCV